MVQVAFASCCRSQDMNTTTFFIYPKSYRTPSFGAAAKIIVCATNHLHAGPCLFSLGRVCAGAMQHRVGLASRVAAGNEPAVSKLLLPSRTGTRPTVGTKMTKRARTGALLAVGGTPHGSLIYTPIYLFFFFAKSELLLGLAASALSCMREVHASKDIPIYQRCSINSEAALL